MADRLQQRRARKIRRPLHPRCVLRSGVLGTLKGKPEIEKAIADQIKKTPKITVHPIAAQQSGNVVWGHGEFVFDNGPVETTGSRSSTTLVRGISPCMFLTRAHQRNSRRYRGASDLAYGACDLITERAQPPEYDPPRVIEVRDAVREDAPAACEVIRRSISELCEADHRNDPEILRRWLANKPLRSSGRGLSSRAIRCSWRSITTVSLQWARSPTRVRSLSTW